MTEVRRLEHKADLAEAWRVFRTAMVGFPRLPLDDESFVSQTFEPGRTYGAFDEDKLVGSANTYSSWLRIPGGARLRHAAVTHVGVLPTQTRRGHPQSAVFGSIAERQGTRRSRGLPASFRGHDLWPVRLRHCEFGRNLRVERRSGAAAGRHLEQRQGTADRCDGGRYAASGNLSVRPSEKSRHDRPALPIGGLFVACFQPIRPIPPMWRCMAARKARTVLSAITRLPPATGSRDTQRTIVVDDLVASSNEAYAALLTHLLAIDLVHRIVLPNRPVDDVLPWLLEDHRHARITAVRDETWLRLLDTRSALAERHQGPERSFSRSRTPDPRQQYRDSAEPRRRHRDRCDG